MVEVVKGAKNLGARRKAYSFYSDGFEKVDSKVRRFQGGKRSKKEATANDSY